MEANRTLQEIVQAVLDSGVSQHELERRTGGVVKRNTLRKIINAGHVPRRDGQLPALAKGVKVTETEIMEAAKRQDEKNMQEGQHAAYAVDLMEYYELNDANKRSVQAHAAALLQAQRRTEELAERIARTEAVVEAAENAVDVVEAPDSAEESDDPFIREFRADLQRRMNGAHADARRTA